MSRHLIKLLPDNVEWDIHTNKFTGDIGPWINTPTDWQTWGKVAELPKCSRRLHKGLGSLIPDPTLGFRLWRKRLGYRA